jgi:DNA-binding transcriptional ArsR family regulator
MTSPQLLWDWGTAYELFTSLEVLHKPAEFGVRAAWAAGVRARLPAPEREILEVSQLLCPLPLHWIHGLPEPKEAITALAALGPVSPSDRLPLLALGPSVPHDVAGMLRAVAESGRWDRADLEMLQDLFRRAGEGRRSPEDLAGVLDWWTRPAEFGERYLAALHAYHDVFFAEEERRLRPGLRQALDRAQALAGGLALPEFLERLSQVRLADLLAGLPDVDQLVVVPSYWSTPRVTFGLVGRQRAMWVYGARPADVSLVPGEVVPEGMLNALKALSDPTRLRILQYLSGEPLTSAQLARRLRLRAQTVAHHLKSLRLAALVRIAMDDPGAERYYAARPEAVAAVFALLQGFLAEGRAVDHQEEEE